MGTFIAATFSGCVDFGDREESSSSRDYTGNETEILVSVYAAGYGQGWIDEACRIYEEKHPEYRFKIRANSRMFDTVKTELTSGTCTSDIVLVAGYDYLNLATTGKLAELLRDEGVPVQGLPGRSPANPLLLRWMGQRLRDFPPDIVHTHDANAATVGAFYKLLHSGTLLIHSRRVSYPLRRGLRSWKYRIADAVVGVSREIADGMIGAGIPASRVSAIHSGIDPSRYRPREARQDGGFLFQSIGAFTPQKGYSVLVRAMAELRKRSLPPWAVRIVGDGPLLDPIREEARTLGVDALLALPGRRDSVDMLPDCDALVVPSVDGEGSSGAIKEGWVTGVPVICSALTSNQELVRGDENGLLAAVGDPVSLADAMARCLTDEGLRARLAEAGSRSVLEFTDTRMAEQYMDLYRRLMGKGTE